MRIDSKWLLAPAVAGLLVAGQAWAQQPGTAPGPEPTFAPGTPLTYSSWQKTCDEPGSKDCCDDCEHHKCHLVIFGEFLYLKVRDVDLIYAQPVNVAGPLALPAGPLGNLRPEYQPGFRVGGGMVVGPVSSILASFTWYENHTQNATQAPDGNLLLTSLEHPNSFNAPFDSLFAKAAYGFDLKLIDVDYYHRLGESNRFALTGILGVRYGHLDQEAEATYSNLETTNVTSAVRFDGIGPRVGVDGTYQLIGGLNAYCNGFANFLIGNFRTDYLQVNDFIGTQAAVSFNDDRIVPVLELEVGAGWTSPGGRISLQAGYYVTCWLNTITNPTFVNAVQTNNFSRNGDTLRDRLTLDGLTARLVFQF